MFLEDTPLAGTWKAEDVEVAYPDESAAAGQPLVAFGPDRRKENAVPSWAHRHRWDRRLQSGLGASRERLELLRWSVVVTIRGGDGVPSRRSCSGPHERCLTLRMTVTMLSSMSILI